MRDILSTMKIVALCLVLVGIADGLAIGITRLSDADAAARIAASHADARAVTAAAR